MGERERNENLYKCIYMYMHVHVDVCTCMLMRDERRKEEGSKQG